MKEEFEDTKGVIRKITSKCSMRDCAKRDFVHSTLQKRYAWLRWQTQLTFSSDTNQNIHIQIKEGCPGRMVVWFTTTYSICTYHHQHCELESHSGDITLCDKVCQWLTTGR